MGDLFPPYILVLCAGFWFFVAILGFFAYMRFLSYKETLALAEKGLVKAQNGHEGGVNQRSMRWAVILIFLGIALCIGLYPIGFLVGADFPLGFGPWMLAGLLPMFFGFALIVLQYLPLLQHILERQAGYTSDANNGGNYGDDSTQSTARVLNPDE